MRYRTRSLTLCIALTWASAYATPAASQQVDADARAKAFRTWCEQSLQKMHAVITPTVSRHTLLNALVQLFDCADRELGQGIASAIVGLRLTSDTVLASAAFTGAFAYRDSAIVRAAAQVAIDRSSSELMRAYGFLSLYTVLAPGGYQPAFREFIGQPRGVVTCGFSVATHSGHAVELTPRSPELVASIGEVARSVRDDPSTTPALHSAAACVLDVWSRR